MSDETAQTRIMENGQAYGSNGMFIAGTPLPQPFATN
jgi:hypothetical protein